MACFVLQPIYTMLQLQDRLFFEEYISALKNFLKPEAQHSVICLHLQMLLAFYFALCYDSIR